MAMRVTLYLISSRDYAHAVEGKINAFEPDMGSATDLDVAWHAIHYLVTGDAELRFLMSGHALEWAAEPLEVHDPESIKRLDQRLAATSARALLREYDAAEFNTARIYPHGWDASGAEFIEPYLARFFGVVGQAAAQGSGLFVVTA